MPTVSSDNLPVRPLHIAILGANAARYRFGPALAILSESRVRIVGIVDEDVKSGRLWARELPGKPITYETADQLILGAPELDAILLSAAFSQRIPIAEKFLEEGISVITEFPNAVSLNSLDSAAMLARANGAAFIPLLLHRYEAAFITARKALDSGLIGVPQRLKSEIAMPLSPAACIESGLVPVGADWYEMVQITACRSLDFAAEVLGSAYTVNADIDLPQHADMVGRRETDPIANIIASHHAGQSTHLLKLSRSVHAFERYLISGPEGVLEMVLSHGEAGATVQGPTLTVHKTGSRPRQLFATENEVESAPHRNRRALAAGLKMLLVKEDGALRLLAARSAMEAVHAAFVSAREGIRIPLPLIPAPDIDALLQI